ncbi:hypothetical protein [Microbacterium sp. TNHR37B]|uniref:hypothetical protein n=1 Tax=Microbacterium sp. TNHR37B TaxID=1775956 RepID=UPI0007B2A600|nr:hypothetical protein [Microbacterium sp. TNHR37B]KZE91325.1 hypothetical protein AVP41_00864 [Microbacterium sp. TNHR37B]
MTTAADFTDRFPHDDQAEVTEEIPQEDLPPSTAQPESQGTDPLIADIGEDGEGDLSPDDLAEPADPAGGPRDLRTELPAASESGGQA